MMYMGYPGLHQHPIRVCKRETKVIDSDKCEYLAQYIILSTTSSCLSNKIKNLKTSHTMWDVVKVNTITKSTLSLLNEEDQLTSMKFAENSDPKVYHVVAKQPSSLWDNIMTNAPKVNLTQGYGEAIVKLNKGKLKRVVSEARKKKERECQRVKRVAKKVKGVEEPKK